MKLTASQLTAMLVSKRIHDQIVNVWSNLFFNGYSVDHVYDRKGNGVLAFRIRDNALQVRDRSGADITELFLSVSKQTACN